MPCQPSLDARTTFIHTQLPPLSKVQAMVLTLWSLGMVLARSCVLTAVSLFLASWLSSKKQAVRQRLREVLQGCGQTGRAAPSARRGGQFHAPAALGPQRVAGYPTGPGPRCLPWARA
jgi:hypothetical protein